MNGVLRKIHKGRARPRTPGQCPHCGGASPQMHRVRAAEGGPWLLRCFACSCRLAVGNPGYMYGGKVVFGPRAKLRRSA